MAPNVCGVVAILREELRVCCLFAQNIYLAVEILPNWSFGFCDGAQDIAGPPGFHAVNPFLDFIIPYRTPGVNAILRSGSFQLLPFHARRGELLRSLACVSVPFRRIYLANRNVSRQITPSGVLSCAALLGVGFSRARAGKRKV